MLVGGRLLRHGQGHLARRHALPAGRRSRTTCSAPACPPPTASGTGAPTRSRSTVDPRGDSENTSTTFKTGILPVTAEGPPCFLRDADNRQGPARRPRPACGWPRRSHAGGYAVEMAIPMADPARRGRPGAPRAEHPRVRLRHPGQDRPDPDRLVDVGRRAGRPVPVGRRDAARLPASGGPADHPARPGDPRHRPVQPGLAAVAGAGGPRPPPARGRSRGAGVRERLGGLRHERAGTR